MGCADQQEKATRVLESVSGQADRAQPTLILISLISLVWGSELIQMGHAGKYQPDSLCQERAGKRRTASSCVSLTSACSETSCVGAWAALFLGLEKNSGRKFLPVFSVSSHQKTSLQGSSEEDIL